MKLLDDLKMYARYAFGLHSYYQTTINLEQARALVTQRLAMREDNFLRLIARGVYENPSSPFLALLKHARCEFGDVEQLVRAKGLTETLRVLYANGVYATFEEFKRRQTIVRAGLEIPVTAKSFDNPFLAGAYAVSSGGSTGAGTRIQIELDHVAAIAPLLLLTQAAHQVDGAPVALWYGIPPDATGLNNVLIQARLNNLPRKWFTPNAADKPMPGWFNHFVPAYTRWLGRGMGLPVPAPEALSFDDALVLAQWAHTQIEVYGKCVIRTHVSSALRVALAARKHKIDLTGLLFFGGGEPATTAKIAEILSSGARYTPTYWMTEVGPLGLGCAQTDDPAEVHLMADIVEMVPIPYQLPDTALQVESFCLTTLLPTAPKILLNLLSDDYGMIETRACGCLLDECGYNTHLRHIRSYKKLTGEGVTLVGSEMVAILENVLPARFGGSALDYQLMEAEGAHGFTRLYLLVHPRLDITDENALLETLWQELRASSKAADIAGSLWKQAGTIEIRREPPRLSAYGKFMPFIVESRVLSEISKT